MQMTVFVLFAMIPLISLGTSSLVTLEAASESHTVVQQYSDTLLTQKHEVKRRKPGTQSGLIDQCAETFATGQRFEIYLIVDLTPSLRFVFNTTRNFLISIAEALPSSAEVDIILITVESILSNPIQRAVGKTNVLQSIADITHTNIDSTSIGRALYLLREGFSDSLSERLFIVITDGMTMETMDVLEHRLDGYREPGYAIYPVGSPATNDLAVLDLLSLGKTSYYIISNADEISIDVELFIDGFCPALEGEARQGLTGESPCGVDPQWCDSALEYCNTDEIRQYCPVTCNACTSTSTTHSTTTTTTETTTSSTITSTTSTATETTVTTNTSTSTTTTTSKTYSTTTATSSTLTSLTETVTSTTSTTKLNLAAVISQFEYDPSGNRCNKDNIPSRAPIFKLTGDGHSLAKCANSCLEQAECNAFVLSARGYCHMFRDCSDRVYDNKAVTFIRIDFRKLETTLAPSPDPTVPTTKSTSTHTSITSITSTLTSTSTSTQSLLTSTTLSTTSTITSISTIAESVRIQEAFTKLNDTYVGIQLTYSTNLPLGMGQLHIQLRLVPVELVQFDKLILEDQEIILSGQSGTVNQHFVVDLEAIARQYEVHSLQLEIRTFVTPTSKATFRNRLSDDSTLIQYRLSSVSPSVSPSAAPTYESNPPTSAIPTAAPSVGCDDYPKNWTDRDGDSCATYTINDWCTLAGEFGSRWFGGDFSEYATPDGYDATYACCGCGGGSTGKQLTPAPISSSPTQFPTLSPTVQPSTSTPTLQPSNQPTTSFPTRNPSRFPSTSPSSAVPSAAPSAKPTILPTQHPTFSKFRQSMSPSGLPTTSPSSRPSSAPTHSTPTLAPSFYPTMIPSQSPAESGSPSSGPTHYPSLYLSPIPSTAPSSCGPQIVDILSASQCEHAFQIGLCGDQSWRQMCRKSCTNCESIGTSAPVFSPTALPTHLPTAAPLILTTDAANQHTTSIDALQLRQACTRFTDAFHGTTCGDAKNANLCKINSWNMMCQWTCSDCDHWTKTNHSSSSATHNTHAHDANTTTTTTSIKASDSSIKLCNGQMDPEICTIAFNNNFCTSQGTEYVRSLCPVLCNTCNQLNSQTTTSISSFRDANFESTTQDSSREISMSTVSIAMLCFLAILVVLLVAIQCRLRSRPNQTAEVIKAIRQSSSAGGEDLRDIRMISPSSPLFNLMGRQPSYEHAHSSSSEHESNAGSIKIVPYAKSEPACSRFGDRTVTYADADESDYELAASSREGTYGLIEDVKIPANKDVKSNLEHAKSSAETELEKKVLNFVMNAGDENGDSIYDNFDQKNNLFRQASEARSDATYETAMPGSRSMTFKKPQYEEADQAIYERAMSQHTSAELTYEMTPSAAEDSRNRFVDDLTYDMATTIDEKRKITVKNIKSNLSDGTEVDYDDSDFDSDEDIYDVAPSRSQSSRPTNQTWK